MSKSTRILHIAFIAVHILFIFMLMQKDFKEKEVYVFQPTVDVLSSENDVSNITKYSPETESVEIHIKTATKDIENVLEKEMVKYYKLMYKQFEQKNVKYVNVLIFQESGDLMLEFHYSLQRIEQIEHDMTQAFFMKHIEDKGLDVLNNADEFNIGDTFKEKLSEHVNKDLGGIK